MSKQKPLPSEIKKQRGTLKKSRQAENSVELITSIDSVYSNRPQCPQDFNKWAVKAWDDVWDFLLQYKFTQIVDMPLVQSYCREVGRMEEANYMMMKEGMIIFTEKGKPEQSPWVHIYYKSLQSVLKLAAEFGFSPSARTKITIPKEEVKSGLKELLKSRQ